MGPVGIEVKESKEGDKPGSKDRKAKHSGDVI